MLLYFAHPIDKAELTETLGYRSVSRDLRTAFDWVFDPGLAFASTSSADLPFEPRVQAINDMVINRCDAVFAMLPDNGKTIGTVKEILHAAQAGIPTLVYTKHYPTGLGSLPGHVLVWQAHPVSGKRHADIQDAVRRLAELVENQRAIRAAAELHPAGKGEPSHLVDGPQTLHYSGPLQAVRSYPGDAAWDVPATESVTLKHGERCRVKTGVYVAPPPNVWLHMVGRSSMFSKGLFVEPGVIDSDWRGELEAKVYNLSNGPVTIEAGERIAQLIPHIVTAQQLVPVDVGGIENLPYGARGSNGWGSTGR